MSVIMSMSDRLYCMAAGEVIAEGSPEFVRSHRSVIASYLGGTGEDTDGTTKPRVRRRAPLRAGAP
jgi:ABC-type multidrug transport system ATPase subunit